MQLNSVKNNINNHWKLETSKIKYYYQNLLKVSAQFIPEDKFLALPKELQKELKEIHAQTSNDTNDVLNTNQANTYNEDNPNDKKN